MTRLGDAGASIADSDIGPLPDIRTTYVNVALPEAFAYHSEALKRALRNSGSTFEAGWKWVERFRVTITCRRRASGADAGGGRSSAVEM